MAVANQQRVERLRELFAHIENEFDALIDENNMLRKQLHEKGIPVAFTPQSSSEKLKLDDRRHRSWIDQKSNYLKEITQKIRAANPPDKTKRDQACKFLREFVGHRDGVLEVRVCPMASSILGSASMDRTARIWTVDDSGPCYVYAGHKGSVSSIRFHPNTRVVLTAAGDGSVHVWRWIDVPGTATGRDVSPLRRPAETRSPWSPLLTPSSNPSTPSVSSAKVTEAKTRTTPLALPENDRPEAPSSPSSRPLASLEDRHQVQGVPHDYELTHAYVIRAPLVDLKGHTGPVAAADWLASGTEVASASWDSTVRVWSADTGVQIAQLSLGIDEPQCVNNLTVSALTTSGLVLLAVSDGTWRVLDPKLPKNQATVHSVLGHEGPVNSALFHNTNQVLSGSDDKTLKVWDLRSTRSPVTIIPCSAGVNRFSISPSTSQLAIPMDNKHTRISDMSGNRTNHMKTQVSEGHHLAVTCTAWSNDESVVYTSSFDNLRPILAWSTNESKEAQKDARLAAANARKAAIAMRDKVKRDQKEAKEVIQKQQKELERAAKENLRKEEKEKEKLEKEREKEQKEKDKRDREREKEREKEKEKEKEKLEKEREKELKEKEKEREKQEKEKDKDATHKRRPSTQTQQPSLERRDSKGDIFPPAPKKH